MIEMKKMKQLLALFAAAALTLGCMTGCKDTENNTGSSASTQGGGTDQPKIAIIKYMEHPSLNTIEDNIIAQLEQLGYEDGKNCEIDLKNAQGEQSTANSIIQGFEADEKDVIIAIATPVAQAAATLADQIPVVFSAVTDPVEAGLVTAMDVTDKNITGTSDLVQVEQILDLAREITPEIQKLGFLYCTGEANSISNLEKTRAYCEEHQIELIESGVANTSEVQQAAQVLCADVDAIFIPNDNTVATAMPAVSNEAIKAKVPVYTGADSMVGDGGLATKGIEYINLGIETANIVDQVIKGTSVNEIPVKVFKDDLSIFVNENTAEALGITIPDSVKSSEQYVVKNTNE